MFVLEASRRPGGTIRSERVDNFLWEAGPNGFLNRDPSTLELADRVGLGDQVICGDEQVRRRYILSRGRLRRFPDSPRTFVTSDLLSVRARARVMLEPAIPPAPPGRDETVGEFARRRLGREAAELLVDPVVSGIYAGDADRLSARAAVPHLAALDGNGKSLIRALLQTRQRPTSQSAAPSGIGRRRYVSFRGGFGQLVGALAESLGPSIRYDSPVSSVRRNETGQGWLVEVGGSNPTLIEADVVVSAAPAVAAAKYLSEVSSPIHVACRSVPYVPVTMVAIGFREADIPHPLGGFGYLVPRREGGNVLGVLWSTSIFPGERSGSGQVLMQAILGGARNQHICDVDDHDILHEVRVQLKRAIGVTAGPVFTRLHRHRVGIPQYQVGHGRRLQAAEAGLMNLPGLLLTGNGFRGVGVNACTADAGRISDAVASYLGASQGPGLAVESHQVPA
ncbi:MAG: oxygen-dependent protoporphyrinogen oxidase [Myxococcota bacterium]